MNFKLGRSGAQGGQGGDGRDLAGTQIETGTVINIPEREFDECRAKMAPLKAALAAAKGA